MPAVKETQLSKLHEYYHYQQQQQQQEEEEQQQHSAKPVSKHLDIIDIRGEAVEINLKDEIASSICPEDGPRMLPTLLLYDEKGLQLFEDVRFFESVVFSY